MDVLVLPAAIVEVALTPVPPPPPLNVTLGAEVYPEPPFVTVKPVITRPPPDAVA